MFYLKDRRLGCCWYGRCTYTSNKYSNTSLGFLSRQNSCLNFCNLYQFCIAMLENGRNLRRESQAVSSRLVGPLWTCSCTRLSNACHQLLRQMPNPSTIYTLYTLAYSKILSCTFMKNHCQVNYQFLDKNCWWHQEKVTKLSGTSECIVLENIIDKYCAIEKKKYLLVQGSQYI